MEPWSEWELELIGMTFNTNEQALIQKSKDMEADAKTLRLNAEQMRRNRLALEAKNADAQRVRDFLTEVAQVARKYDLKFEGVDNWRFGAAASRPDLDFVLIDTQKWNRFTVTPVANYGFKWTDGKSITGQNY